MTDCTNLKQPLFIAALALLLTLILPRPAVSNGWEHTAIDFEVLVAALDDSNAGIRRRAAESLGFRQQAGAAAALLARLDKKEPVARVRQEIYHSLGRLGDAAALDAIETCLDAETEAAVRIECTRACGNIDSPRAAQLALEASRNNNRAQHLMAIASLGSFSDAAVVTRLESLADSEDTAIRETALMSLGRGGSPRASATLLAALSQAKDTRQTIVALQALTLLADPATAKDIRKLYSSSIDETIKRFALVAMASTRAAGSRVYFLDALSSADAASRMLGLTVLSEYGDAKDAAAVVEHALADNAKLLAQNDAQLQANPAQTIAALQLLNQYLATVIRLDPAAGGRLFRLAAQEKQLSRNSSAALTIAQGFYMTRWQALYGLGYGDAANAGETLESALADPDARIRAVAVRSMGVLENSDFAQSLKQALSDDSAEVRWTAARVLGRSKNPGAATALLKSLGDSFAQVRLEAAIALGYLKVKEAKPALLELAQADPDSRVSEAARYAASLID